MFVDVHRPVDHHKGDSVAGDLFEELLAVEEGRGQDGAVNLMFNKQLKV
ncbi:MAG TPA: hypothetical protein VHY31_08145 [Streptosporangiaceae bacterium]|nr:hypothetical protein [Streptosporangiaceae bacterium]